MRACRSARGYPRQLGRRDACGPAAMAAFLRFTPPRERRDLRQSFRSESRAAMADLAAIAAVEGVDCVFSARPKFGITQPAPGRRYGFWQDVTPQLLLIYILNYRVGTRAR